MAFPEHAGDAHSAGPGSLAADRSGGAEVTGAPIVFLFGNAWVSDVVDHGVRFGIRSDGTHGVWIRRGSAIRPGFFLVERRVDVFFRTLNSFGLSMAMI
jgi:hypothetical protein